MAKSRNKSGGRRKAGKTRPSYLVLADLPERHRVVELQRRVDTHRDRIAELDLEIEGLRSNLARFESDYSHRLSAELRLVLKVRGVVRYLVSWSDLLLTKPDPQLLGMAGHAEKRRNVEVAEWQKQREENEWGSSRRDKPARREKIDEPPPTRESFERLKSAYRALARHYHPDLATTEAERLKFSEIMRRINELYHSGDLNRLQILVDQSKEMPDALAEATLEEQLQLLEERSSWFETIVLNLQEELTQLQASEIYELWDRARRYKRKKRDLIEEIRNELLERLEQLYDEISWAITNLEKAVTSYNTDLRSIPPAIERRRGNTQLERVFDPFAEKSLVRLGLETLDTSSIDRPTKRRVDWIVSLAETAPAQLRLLLLTHISQLSHQPLPGLDTFEELHVRFESLNSDIDDASLLERSLAELADILEYGVRRASVRQVHIGLRYRSEGIRNAMPFAMQEPEVKHEFRRVLWVLGEAIVCTACNRPVFAIPVYYTRGLDDLRASVCPECGQIINRYYLPKGDDVQAVLNPAYIDHGIITEWSFQLARASFFTQILPIQEETLTVNDLKKRIINDLFNRYELGLSRGHVNFYQGRTRVKEGTPLIELGSRRFAVRFRKDTPLTEGEALEILRFRIRNKFK